MSKKPKKPIHHYTHKKPIVPSLKRDLGLFHATIYGVGLILGAGIYVLAGKAAGTAGNMVWLSFLIAAVCAAFTGFSYAELSSMFSDDAGEYYYGWKAFGEKIAFIIGYLVVFSGIISAAAVAIGFSGYFSSLFGTNHALLISIAVLVVFSLVNFLGIKQAAWVNAVFTFVEIGGLVAIILLGSKYIGSVNYLDLPSLKGLFSAASLIFFAFLGFQSVIKLSEETKNPTKVIPKALILSLVITTIMYILIGLAVVSVVGWEQLGASDAPLADVASAILGSKAFVVMAVAALFSTANTVLISLITTSRQIYGMSRSRCIPKVFSKVHKKTKTPHYAVLLVFILSAGFAMLRDVELVANITNFGVFLTFILVNLALIVLRYKMPDKNRDFRAPFNIKRFPVFALLGIIVSGFMLVNLGVKVILIGIGLVVIGFILEIILAKMIKKDRTMKIHMHEG